jgi:hypothetical protein
MSRFSKRQKIIALIGGTIVVLAGGGIAYAFWSSSEGTGTGTAVTAAQSNTLTVVQDNTPSGLAPGVAPVAVQGHIRNGGSGQPAFVTQVVVKISEVSPPGCTPANYALAVGAPSSTPLTNPATTVPGTTPSITLPINQEVDPGTNVTLPDFNIGFVNFNTNQDVCQTAVPTLSYTAT